MKPLELTPMMSEQENPPKESRAEPEITLKREMFPEGAKFWVDDGTPKVTTPDGKVFAAGPDKFVEATARFTPNPYGPFVREVGWEEFVEAIRAEYLRIALN